MIFGYAKWYENGWVDWLMEMEIKKNCWGRRDERDENKNEM